MEMQTYMMSSGVFRDEDQAVDVLKATLKALRDRLPKVKAYNLGVQLPPSIRHAYFEGWHNGQRQADSATKSEFLTEVNEHLVDADYDLGEMVPVAMRFILTLLKDNDAQTVREELPMFR